MRPDGREPDELRPITIERDFTSFADGSVLVCFGETRVLCTAMVDDDVPRWMRNTGKGWVTAEYSMLPGSSPDRINRERRGPKGRTHEIERLIGRSLRAICDMRALGERQVLIDCDVLQADGGTRTASITGAWIALHDALSRQVAGGAIKANPITDHLAAVSVGIIDGEARLDLPYSEDSRADVDMNVVMCGDGRLVEVQGTAEDEPFTRAQLDQLVDLAAGGIAELVELQREMIAVPPPPRPVASR
jgi:ribonuclease PH